MHVRLRGYYAQIRLIVPIGVLVATRPCPCSRNSQYQTNGACQRFPLTRLDRPPVPSRGTLLLQHGVTWQERCEQMQRDPAAPAFPGDSMLD